MKAEKDSSATIPIYHVSFEDYLKPKSVKKQKSLLFHHQNTAKTHMRLKLLEHPVLIAAHKSKWFLYKEKVDQVFKTHLKKTLKFLENVKTQATKFTRGHLRLPRFLAFLNARNDVTACKRKSGFEIYCEIASIHGFTNFVGATTWQRAFWFLVVLMAVIMSGFVLLLSHFMNVNTPTILYSESTQYPTWSIPFPAITICNINRISKRKAEKLANKFQANSNTNMSLNALINSFNLVLSTTENISGNFSEYRKLNSVLKSNNYTMLKLLDDIVTNCDKELVRCLFHGEFIGCGHLFKKTHTSFGQCCSFNYKALKKASSKLSVYTSNNEKGQIYNCGHLSGLSVLLDPRIEDYKASSTLTAGFRVLLHDAYDFPDIATMQRIITPATSNKIRIWPQQTYATEHINSLKINIRKCYLPNERKMYHFGSYSLVNCLAECRSLMFYKKCHCVLPFRPKMHNWTVCGLEDIQCYFKYKSTLISDLKYSNSLANDEQYLCDCYPLCNFHLYNMAIDSGMLARKYSLTEKRLFKNINVTNHILLRVFISELHAERLRLDVYENWLSFLGTFGGITGLYMGYSFLSGFELIFFVFVRPACNWLTRKQIKYRLQKKAKQEEERKRKLEQQKEQ